MASLSPRDKCPPATAVALAVTLRRRRRGESRVGAAVTGITTRAKAYAPNGRFTRLAPVVTFARAGELQRWVKNKDDKRQALTNGRAAVGDQAAEDTRASRIIDPHDTSPAGTAARAGITPTSPVRSTDPGLASTAWR